MRGINIQKYSNVFEEERVFSYVGCLSLSGFDEIFEAVFEAGTSVTEKAERERKMLQNIYAPMLRILNCISLTGKVKLFLEIEMKRERERESAFSVSQIVCERESAVSGSQNGKKERVCSLWKLKCVCVWESEREREKESSLCKSNVNPISSFQIIFF